VGGRSDAENERLFAFEFPERQGALHKFLTTLQPGLNISLFHYRNYGGDVAKILAAIQCPAGEVSYPVDVHVLCVIVLLTYFSRYRKQV
jgi:threonine dehydratase